jgi:SAM-dependent methyltransferase
MSAVVMARKVVRKAKTLPLLLRGARQKILPVSRVRFLMTFAGYHLNALGIRMMAWGRNLVRYMNRHITDEQSDRFVAGLPVLHARINNILRRQRKDYPHYSYFSGYPYQSLGILGIYGERASEERFDSYNLAQLVTRDDYVLDIGCNCGFMSVLTSYRTGAKCHGIDINSYMTDIGTECAKFLNIADKVLLEGKKFQDIEGREIYTVIYSFATHWTDDGNYRVALKDHLMKIHGLLKQGGLLVFESHCADVGEKTFYATMEEMREAFTWNGMQKTDNGLRELYLMRKK